MCGVLITGCGIIILIVGIIVSIISIIVSIIVSIIILIILIPLNIHLIFLFTSFPSHSLTIRITPRHSMRHMSEMQHINIRAENVPNCALFPIHAHGNRTKDPRNVHFVSRLHAVEQIIIRIQRHRLGRFALRHVIGDFLHLNKLFVSEETAVVVHLQRVGDVAVGTSLRLADAVAVAIHLQAETTRGAAEGGDTKVREKVAHARDHALETYKTLDVVRAQTPHRTLRLQVEHAQMQLLSLQRVALAQVLNHLVQYLLEDVDHHSRSLHHLSVEGVRLGKGTDIRKVEIENALSLLQQLRDLLNVQRARLALCLVVIQKVTERHHRLGYNNVRSQLDILHLKLRTHRSLA